MSSKATDDSWVQHSQTPKVEGDAKSPAPSHGKRYEDWRNGIAKTFPELDIISRTPQPIAGHIEVGQCGFVKLVRLTGEGHVLERTKAQIDRSPAEHPYFCWQRADALQIAHGHGTDELKTGGFVIHDSNRPHRLHMESPFDLLCTQIPEAVVRERTGASIQRWTGSLIDLSPSIHRIVAATMLGLTDRHETEADAFAVGDLFIEVVGRGLAEKDRSDKGPSPAAARRAIALRRFVEAHAHLGTLSPADASAELGCSLRLVHATAASLGTTFGRMVVEARLQTARALLIGPGLHNISQVALMSGFSDLSYFSRAFKSRFGLSPRAYKHR